MTIQPMDTTAPPSGSSSKSSSSPADAVNQDQFLQLLVAQIRYQDPTNPTDSTAFVTQLAQFSSLEQLVAIRGDLDNQSNAAGAQTTAPNQGGH